MSDEPIITKFHEAQSRYNIALLGAETGGQLSMRVQDALPGFGPPLHLHTDQAETFHIVRGVFRFQVGQQELIAPPGLTVHVPKGVPHCFVFDGDGEEQGRIVSILTPGIHDGFIEQIPRARDAGTPIEELTGMAEQFGAQIIGPPLRPR